MMDAYSQLSESETRAFWTLRIAFSIPLLVGVLFFFGPRSPWVRLTGRILVLWISPVVYASLLAARFILWGSEESIWILIYLIASILIWSYLCRKATLRTP